MTDSSPSGTRLLFGSHDDRPIRLMHAQGSWHVFLRWDLVGGTRWFDKWTDARDCAFAAADRLSTLGGEAWREFDHA